MRLEQLGEQATDEVAEGPDCRHLASAATVHEVDRWSVVADPVDQRHFEPPLQQPGQQRQIVAEVHAMAAQDTFDQSAAVGNPPQEFAQWIERDLGEWRQVVRRAGIRPE